MAAPRRIEVEVVGDARRFQLALLRVELRMIESPIVRLRRSWRGRARSWSRARALRREIEMLERDLRERPRL